MESHSTPSVLINEEIENHQELLMNITVNHLLEFNDIHLHTAYQTFRITLFIDYVNRYYLIRDIILDISHHC